jgi:hypothetical protein
MAQRDHGVPLEEKNSSRIDFFYGHHFRQFSTSQIKNILSSPANFNGVFVLYPVPGKNGRLGHGTEDACRYQRF